MIPLKSSSFPIGSCRQMSTAARPTASSSASVRAPARLMTRSAAASSSGKEIADQIRALQQMKEMAAIYGYDISQPAKDAKEAVQWLYFGYLAAIKTQNGAAMSVGRISTFLDIYIERDMKNGVLTESEAQELIDHMVMKFRMVKFARIPSK